MTDRLPSFSRPFSVADCQNRRTLGTVNAILNFFSFFLPALDLQGLEHVQAFRISEACAILFWRLPCFRALASCLAVHGPFPPFQNAFGEAVLTLWRALAARCLTRSPCCSQCPVWGLLYCGGSGSFSKSLSLTQPALAVGSPLMKRS